MVNRTARSYLILWQNDRAVIVGQNQNTEAEINRTFVQCNDIRVVRRSSGGGAVYHDLGNLNYSFITDFNGSYRATLQTFARPIVDALNNLGLSAELSGRNDILVNGRKVSGTAQRIVNGRLLHHGTLLFDCDLYMMENALQANPDKFRYKGTKSIRSRVSNIRESLTSNMDFPSF